MPRNQSPAQSNPVPLVAVQGHVSLTEAFFEHLDKTLTMIVKGAVNDCLKEKVQSNSVPGDQRVERTGDPTKTGIDLAPGQRQKAGSVLASAGLNLGLKEGQVLIDTDALVRLMDVSPRTVGKLTSIGAIPKPISVGRLKRWSVEEILAWVFSGCPTAERWQRIRYSAMRDYKSVCSAPRRE